MEYTAAELKMLFATWAQIMRENKDFLIELDSVVGDADLGLTMGDGFTAASHAADAATETDIGKLSYLAGKAMASAVPSTMGTLMASGFMNAGKCLKGTVALSDAEIAKWISFFYEGVQQRGKAELGDKTFLDGLHGAMVLLNDQTSAGKSLKEIGFDARTQAEEDFKATFGMLAKHGRAGARGEASRAMLDPGAAVAMLMIRGLFEFILKF